MKRARISSLASDTAALNINDKDDTDSTKIIALERSGRPAAVIRCSLPPHEPQDFTDIASYETHYLSAHSYRCSECHSNFPSEHFLELHINELHDPISQARRAAGQKTYMCFIEDCDKICSDWKKRRSHLIDKHGFPRNYDFFVVRDGVDGRRSLLRAGVDEQGHRKSSRERERHSQVAPDNKISDDESSSTGTPDVQTPSSHDEVLDNLASSFSTMRMVPRSVTFGRRKGKAGFSKS